MRYDEVWQRTRQILAEVDADQELGLVRLLGDMEYGVLEKVLASEITAFIDREICPLEGRAGAGK